MVVRLTDGDLAAAVTSAVEAIDAVRHVAAVRVGSLTTVAGEPRPLIAVRIGLSPTLTLPEIGRIIDQVSEAAARRAPTAVVFVEPTVAADDATPTEAIVIRGAE